MSRKAVVVTSTRWQEKFASRSLDSISFLRDKLITFEDWLFTQRRIWLYGSGSVVAYAIGLVARLFQHRWLFQEDGTLSCIDFSTMWVTGIFAGSSDPARMYDDSAWAAAWKSLTSLEGCPPRSRPYELSSDSAVFHLSFRVDALRCGVCRMDGSHAAALSGGHLPDRAPSDRYFGGAFTIPCVFQFLSRTEWIPPRRVDGIVPRFDGAAASIIRNYP
jgi:hypothetical protein